MGNLRKKIIYMLIKVLFDGGYSNIIISKALSEIKDRHDKNIMTKCFYGVIEHKLGLDFALTTYCNTKQSKLDKEILCILYLGTYEILYMDSIPQRATINECVNLCKAMKKTSASGMVNAVLRKIDTNKTSLLENIDKDPIKRFSIAPWLYKRLKSDLGDEQANKFLCDAMEVPNIYVRIFGELGSDSQNMQDTILPRCKILKDVGMLSNENGSKNWYVQDMASQICAECIPAKEGDIAIDICAAPGGKSFILSEKIGKYGKIISCDISKNKCEMIKNTADELGIENQVVLVNDGAEFSQEMPKADVVLCDVPCSGFGVIRRRPEIKYKSEEEATPIPKKQLEILSTSAKYVKSGGYLIYSTCTLLKNENEKVISNFLNENSSFVLDEISTEMIGKNNGMITLLPQEYGCDGFFICKMRRK